MNQSITHLEVVIQPLILHARATGNFMAWHKTTDPKRWLIAEVLLRRTTRIAAEKAYIALISRYPEIEYLAKASEEEIGEIVAPIGLIKQRSKQLKQLASTLLEDYGGVVPCSRAELLHLPGVGEYAADAVLLYSCKQKAIPIDGGIQRVLRRIAALPTPSGSKAMRGTRRIDFKKDPWIKEAVSYLVANLSNVDLVQVHKGLLLVAWETCRAIPNCPKCVLRDTCGYAQR